MTQQESESTNETVPAQQPPPQEVPAPRIETVYINFTAAVDEVSTEALLGILAQCHQAGIETVHLLIATSGGSVMCGMALYNMLRAYPFRVVTWNIGNVDSIGNTVFLAGDERYASPHTTFMFHSVTFTITSIERQEPRLLRERLASIEADNTRLGRIVAERANLSEDAAAALYAEAKTIDTDEAVSLGLINEIRQIAIPNGAAVMHVSFPRR